MRKEHKNGDLWAAATAAALLSIAAIFLRDPPLWLGAVVAASAAGLSGWTIRCSPHGQGAAAVVLLPCFLAFSFLALPFLGWPLGTLLPLALYSILAWKVPRLRPAPGWARRGKGGLAWIPAFVVATALALWGWVSLMQPDITQWAGLLPDLPVPLLLLGGLLFALANAAVEEGLFRGVAQSWLTTRCRSPWPGIVAQAVAFGLLHWNGFPSGPVGALMAGGWALGLGILRHRTGGLLAPYLCHVAADLTIFGLVLLFR